MATYTILFQLASGKSIRGYIASAAGVGTYLPVDKIAVPTANSPEEVQFDANDIITDVICSAASGTVELIANGTATGRLIDAAPNQATNAGRQKFQIPILAGVQYRLRVAGAFPA